MAHPDTSHISFTYPPRPPRGSLPFHYLLCNWTHPYPVTLLPIGSGYFRAKPSPIWILQLFSNLVIIHLPAYEDGTDTSVPKRPHIKFRCQGIHHHHWLDSPWWTLAFLRNSAHSSLSRATFFQFLTSSILIFWSTPSSHRIFGLPTLLTPTSLVFNIIFFELYCRSYTSSALPMPIF